MEKNKTKNFFNNYHVGYYVGVILGFLFFVIFAKEYMKNNQLIYNTSIGIFTPNVIVMIYMILYSFTIIWVCIGLVIALNHSYKNYKNK